MALSPAFIPNSSICLRMRDARGGKLAAAIMEDGLVRSFGEFQIFLERDSALLDRRELCQSVENGSQLSLSQCEIWRCNTD